MCPICKLFDEGQHLLGRLPCGQTLHDGRADNGTIGDARHAFGVLRRLDAETDADRQVAGLLDAGDFSAARRSSMSEPKTGPSATLAMLSASCCVLMPIPSQSGRVAAFGLRATSGDSMSSEADHQPVLRLTAT